MSNRQAKFLRNRLALFGFEDLESYSSSECWLNTVAKYMSTKLPKVCQVCGSADATLYHRSFARLGEECLNDLVPLCLDHYEEMMDGELDMWDAAKVMKRRRESDQETRLSSLGV